MSAFVCCDRTHEMSPTEYPTHADVYAYLCAAEALLSQFGTLDDERYGIVMTMDRAAAFAAHRYTNNRSIRRYHAWRRKHECMYDDVSLAVLFPDKDTAALGTHNYSFPFYTKFIWGFIFATYRCCLDELICMAARTKNMQAMYGVVCENGFFDACTPDECRDAFECMCEERADFTALHALMSFASDVQFTVLARNVRYLAQHELAELLATERLRLRIYDDDDDDDDDFYLLE